MDGDLLGDLIHAQDILPVDVYVAGQSQVSFQCTCQVVVFDVFCRTNQGIHQDQKVVGAVVFLLMIEQEIRESLFESDHRFSLILVSCPCAR